MTIAINIIAVIMCMVIHIADKDKFFAMLALGNAIMLGINIGRLL